MKTYLRNEIILAKGSYTNQVFKIIKGHIKTKHSNQIFQKDDYLFIDIIFAHPYTLDDYIAQDQVIGEWIEKEQITFSHFPILAYNLWLEKLHVELLLLNDSLIKVARYFFFETIIKQTTTFYTSLNQKELAFYLNLTPQDLSEQIKHLERKSILRKNNKLFNILDIKKLEDIAYLLDYS